MRAGLGVPVELLDRLFRAEPGGPDAKLGTGCVPGCDLAVQDRGEVLLLASVCLAGVVGQSRGGLDDPRWFIADAR